MIEQKEHHFIKEYFNLVKYLINQHPDNIDLAMAKAVGSPTLESFYEIGEKQFAVLKFIGLKDGMSIYDLGCGSGRTAMALKRHNWTGNYTGQDIVPELIIYASSKVSDPNFKFYINPNFQFEKKMK
ncbi:class I SAM-dependent methyltransferase [Sulfurihydrogenibium sp.]|uniref:class I SAM-dependent methyltransferase n=1 Tax=Sulfurihydrogenibium sp. TaxID=2053621 RepID=UPI0026304F41|nr:class I SAM-dependent methyltransferase [Sulfurihydrogenibium sp.]